MKIKIILLSGALIAAGLYIYPKLNKKPTIKTVADSVQTVAQAQINECKDNDLSKLILVSINKRHMWACEANKEVYDTAVVTGDMNHAADLTPVGSYKVYAKETNRTLAGKDDKGSWNVHVDYWMPFLDNQYGTYGFHDASWRKDSDFGKIDPYSSDASHGCVEATVAATKWFYNWSPVGTDVKIEP